MERNSSNAVEVVSLVLVNSRYWATQLMRPGNYFLHLRQDYSARTIGSFFLSTQSRAVKCTISFIGSSTTRSFHSDLSCEAIIYNSLV